MVLIEYQSCASSGEGSNFRVCGLDFQVYDLGSGFEVWGLGLGGFGVCISDSGFRFAVFRLSVCNFGLRLRFAVSVCGFQGFGYGVTLGGRTH